MDIGKEGPAYRVDPPKTHALIVVFDEPVDVDIAEQVLTQLEDEGEEMLVEGRSAPDFHVEHASILRLDKLYAELLNDGTASVPLTEAAATMMAAAAYHRELHDEELPAKNLASGLDELAGAVRRLRAVTS
jgi:hypothetical protein